MRTGQSAARFWDIDINEWDACLAVLLPEHDAMDRPTLDRLIRTATEQKASL